MSKFTRPGKNLSKKSASRRRRHIRVRKKITGTTKKVLQETKQHKQKLLVKKLPNVQLLLALKMLCLIAPDASTTDESLL
jgi:hypothetical protein